MDGGGLPTGGLGVAVEVGRIASAPGTSEQRAKALLDSLGPLVPFQAATICLLDEAARGQAPLVSVGYDERLRGYMASPEHTDEMELVGFRRTRRPIRVRDLPVPREEIRSWVQYLAPAGFREGLGVGLFTPDGRYLGVLGLNTEHPGHPTDAARDLIGMLAPVIANAVDPLRSTVEAARMVRNAVAGVVLTHRGETRPLAGLPPHPMLLAGSAAIAAADRLARENTHGSFLCPQRNADGADGYLRVTVLACPSRVPGRCTAAVVASPPGDLHGLTQRELQVAGLLIEGWPNPRIATALFIAKRTVATHVENILAKFGAPSRTLAAARALRFGSYIPREVTCPG